jgi:hypothetical protein
LSRRGASGARRHLFVFGLISVDPVFAVDDFFAVVTFAVAGFFAGVFAVDDVLVADGFLAVESLSATVFFAVAGFELVDVFADFAVVSDLVAAGTACVAMATFAAGVGSDDGSGGSATATGVLLGSDRAGISVEDGAVGVTILPGLGATARVVSSTAGTCAPPAAPPNGGAVLSTACGASSPRVRIAAAVPRATVAAIAAAAIRVR